MKPFRKIGCTAAIGLALLIAFTFGIPLIIPVIRAQSPASEEEIRRLEQLEVRAIIARDTKTLQTLWDAAYIVNNPDNVVVEAKPDLTDRPGLQKARLSFYRQVRAVICNR